MISLPDPTGKLTLSTKLDEGLELCAAAPSALWPEPGPFVVCFVPARFAPTWAVPAWTVPAWTAPAWTRSRLALLSRRYRVSVPLGVICVIFEARPDAAVQVCQCGPSQNRLACPR